MSPANRNPYLSEHFSLAELTASQAADRAGLANVPTDAAMENLRRLAAVLEWVRACLGHVPMLVTSGFRATKVNALVGGAASSAHLEGRAADFIAPRFGSPREVCRRIHEAGIEFDQLIYEGSWVHLGIAKAGVPARGQLLTAVFRAGLPTNYWPGIHP